MRHLTDEEVEIVKKLHDENLTEEEKKKLVDRLHEIDIEETGGHLWLT